ncbi:MAG TPA: sigma-54 dependent transcriptional regulator, partial [Candidatus Binataceae bacterium]|nr:sigma-54 dependent transcriptional regulator [Candidatus Binataceae bacterium]
MANILVVDDDRNIRRMLATALEAAGYSVVEAGSAAQALARLGAPPAPDLVLTDVRMENMDGIALLEQIKHLRPAMPVIIMTAFGSIPAAVEAMRLGAYDYVPKPFSAQQIRQTVARALEIQSLKQENRALKSRLERLSGMERFLASSQQTTALLEVAAQAAASDATVLLTGESGTGKSLLARYIHQQSPRKGGPFVSVACTTLSEHLLESELFGHVRGAFTGAIKDKPGRLEAAEGGTIFLDEIGDLSLALQAKLLRFLQEKTFERVGGSETLRIDARIIAATNLDLDQLVKEKRLREDLYYRLNVIELRLPSLRERPAEIPALTATFIEAAAATHGKKVLALTPEASAALLAYTWPGNVRELRNVLERAVVLSRGDAITVNDLPDRILAGAQ